MKQKTRFRLRQVFWLDLLKPDEAELASIIDGLKIQRSFATTVRDGIRLISDLKAGRLDVLFELFPWVRAEFLEYVQSVQPPAEIALQKRLDSLEKLLLQQGNVPIKTGPTKLVVQSATQPTSEDGDLLVIRQTKSERESAKNFLNAAFDLVQ
jgi:hypothetical protein